MDGLTVDPGEHIGQELAVLVQPTKEKLLKKDWIVRPVCIDTARALVEKFHYARSATCTRVYTFGLFRDGSDFFDNQCLGVSWWLPPTRVAAESCYQEGDWRKVLALTRLVIDPSVPRNACSFLLSKSVKLINKDKWHCLLTYADSFRGHTGAIYRAANWEYMGETKPSPVYVDKQGRIMGRKRGASNLTHEDMLSMGFSMVGKYRKHRYRLIIKTRK